MAAQAERKAQTRLKIIKSAQILFEQHGFDETSVEQIFTAANIAKGTFYKYFKTKLDVLIAVNKENARQVTRAALQEVAGGADALTVLENYMQILGAWFEAREKLARAMVITQLGKPGDREENIDPETTTRGFVYQILVSAQQQGSIRNDVDAKQLAEMVGGFIVVSVINWSHHPQPGELVASLKQSLTLFLEGAQHGVDKS